MASVTVHCPRCQSAQVYRHGQNPKGRDCHRVFLLTYAYEARKPGVKEKITTAFRMQSESTHRHTQLCILNMLPIVTASGGSLCLSGLDLREI